MSRWFLRLILGATLLVSAPAIATDGAGHGPEPAIESPAASAGTSAVPVATSAEPHSPYAYRPYCDPHSDSYAARNCHASCAAWWCDLYWNQRP